MPPRPQPRMVSRKNPNVAGPSPSKNDAAKSNTSTMTSNSKPTKTLTEMLPPPPPVPTTILGVEMQALEGVFRETAVNTGRVFRFYADTRRERLAHRAPYPPNSTTRALARSLEHYDQLCDTIEIQLQHAISVLERDLKAERTRVEREETALRATRKPSLSPSAPKSQLPDASSEQILTTSPTGLGPMQFPPPSGASAISMMPRRASAILSSLHRPTFPLKLDLSAATLSSAGSMDNMNTIGTSEPLDVGLDLSLATGLPSPVTLAPKTARAIPNDQLQHDLFGQVQLDVDMMGGDMGGGGVGMKTVGVGGGVIDLTVGDGTGDIAQLGNSADKPIELDLDDMGGIFGPSNVNANDTSNTADPSNVVQQDTQLDVDMDMDNLFTPQETENTFQLPSSAGQDTSNATAGPSDILASLTASSNENAANELSSLLPSAENTVGGMTDGDTVNVMTGQTGGDTFGNVDLEGLDLASFGGFFSSENQGDGNAGNLGNINQGEDMDLMEQLFTMEGQGGNVEGGGT